MTLGTLLVHHINGKLTSSISNGSWGAVNTLTKHVKIEQVNFPSYQWKIDLLNFKWVLRGSKTVTKHVNLIYCHYHLFVQKNRFESKKESKWGFQDDEFRGFLLIFSQSISLTQYLPACLFQLVSWEVSLTILNIYHSTMLGSIVECSITAQQLM